ncbi:hypothetical protein D3C72_1735400 [compost metagenome]
MIRGRLHRRGFARWLLLLFWIRRGRAALFFGHDLPPLNDGGLTGWKGKRSAMCRRQCRKLRDFNPPGSLV